MNARGRLTRTLALVLGLTVLVGACAGPAEPGSTSAGEPAGPQAPEEDQGFDRDRSTEQARSYLGLAEDEVVETVMVRILRRGEERLAGTMDLRPGRLNLELDEDGAGVYRVSRVVVETEDGANLVIE